MKIAYLVNYYPDFSHIFIRREIKALEAQGIEVVRFAMRGWDFEVVDEEDTEEKKKTQYLLEGGLTGLFWPTLRLMAVSPTKFLRTLMLAIRLCKFSDRSFIIHLIYLAEACKLVLLCKTINPTHIHAHFGTNSTEIALLAKSLGGPPYSFTVHGPEEFDKPLTIHLTEKIEHAKFVVAVSSFGRSQLFRWVSHRHWPKIREVHCGLDATYYTGKVVDLVPNSRFVCVGRLCEQKGQLLLLQAVKKLRDRGLDIELVLAGDGEMREIVEASIRDYGLEKNIRITGWISNDQVREEILQSRALVLPSFAEGLPSVIMEAMALHRPVLTTYIAGIPELALNKEHGWVFPAGSVEALTEAIEECLNSPVELLRKMGEAGYARVRERHDIDRESVKLAELFRAKIFE